MLQLIFQLTSDKPIKNIVPGIRVILIVSIGQIDKSRFCDSSIVPGIILTLISHLKT